MRIEIKNILFVLFILCFLSSNITAQNNKYALIIAIGNYNKATTGWNKISSKNDVPLIKQSLVKQGFKEYDISVLEDNKATKVGIISALNRLTDKASVGSYVVVHYSGHGQQISDISGDEIDGLDEALVSIDAPSSLQYGSDYRGEKHLTDDEFGRLINKIRKKIGSKGQVVVIIDACYSGTGIRGNSIARGGKEPFIFLETLQVKKTDTGSSLYESIEKTRSLGNDLSPYILFSASKPNELNFETTDKDGNSVGSLTYALSKSLNKMNNNSTYSSVYVNVLSIMKDIAPYQTPMIEGDINYQVFNGNIGCQQPHFSITKVISNSIIEINGGTTSGLSIGDTVSVNKAGAISVDRDLCFASGIITQIDNFSSLVDCGLNCNITNRDNYWVFSKSKKQLNNQFQTYLDLDYYVDMELVPVVVKYDSEGNLLMDNMGKYIIEDTLNLDDFIHSDNLQFRATTQFIMKFTNRGNKRAYFGVVDIQPDDIINKLYPSGQTTFQECVLDAGKSFTATNFIINGFSPPYGKETFVILSNKDVIDLNTIVSHNEDRTKSRAYYHDILTQPEYFKTGSIIPLYFYVNKGE